MIPFFLLIVFAAANIFYLLRFKSVISLTMTDLAVLAFLLYGMLYIAIVQSFGCDPLVWFKWGAVGLCYLFFRQLKKARVVLYGILLYTLFQSVVAIGQSLSFFQSEHRFFSVTGTMGNPGPLGGFLAIAMVCCIGLLRDSSLRGMKQSGLRTFGIASFLAMTGTGLILTDSRAAFLSALIGLAVVWGDRILKLFNRYKTFTLITFSSIILLLCCLLYLYRPASADSRGLIWRVSAGMITEKPLFGYGVGAFDREYLLHQAAYFDREPQSSLAMVADNTAYPYNEWIHVWMELGAVGCGLLLAIFITGMSVRSSCRFSRPLKAGLASFMVFSCFSYPVEVVELLFIPPALLGVLPKGKPACLLPVRTWMKFIGIALLAGLIFLSIKGISVFRKIESEINQLAAAGTQIPTPCIDRYFPVYKYNADFNMTYLPLLCQLPCQMENRKKINEVFPSSETYCHLGEACECYGEYVRAEQVYRQAANMVPTRVLPNYRLWKLYVKRGDSEQAHAMAQKILTQPVKVETTFTLQVKGEMRRYLIN